MSKISLKNYPRGIRLAAIILSQDKEKVVLIKRYKSKRHYFVFPGGGLETTDKNKKEALLREIKEETNLSVEIISQPYQLNILGHSQQFFYICKHLKGNPAIIGEEKERQNNNNQYAVGWFPVKDLNKITLYPLEIRDWLLDDLTHRRWQKRKITVPSFEAPKK